MITTREIPVVLQLTYPPSTTALFDIILVSTFYHFFLSTPRIQLVRLLSCVVPITSMWRECVWSRMWSRMWPKCGARFWGPEFNVVQFPHWVKVNRGVSIHVWRILSIYLYYNHDINRCFVSALWLLVNGPSLVALPNRSMTSIRDSSQSLDLKRFAQRFIQRFMSIPFGLYGLTVAQETYTLV